MNNNSIANYLNPAQRPKAKITASYQEVPVNIDYQNSILPVTVRQLQSAKQYQSDGAVYVDGREVSMVKLIAQISSKTVEINRIILSLKDASGTFIECNIWGEYSNVDPQNYDAVRYSKLTVGDTVVVSGRINVTIAGRQITGYDVKILDNTEDSNLIIQMHDFEVALAHEYNLLHYQTQLDNRELYVKQCQAYEFMKDSEIEEEMQIGNSEQVSTDNLTAPRIQSQSQSQSRAAVNMNEDEYKMSPYRQKQNHPYLPSPQQSRQQSRQQPPPQHASPQRNLAYGSHRQQQSQQRPSQQYPNQHISQSQQRSQQPMNRRPPQQSSPNRMYAPPPSQQQNTARLHPQSAASSNYGGNSYTQSQTQAPPSLYDKVMKYMEAHPQNGSQRGVRSSQVQDAFGSDTDIANALQHLENAGHIYPVANLSRSGDQSFNTYRDDN